MIEKLVIGPRCHQGEIVAPQQQPPHAQRRWIREAHADKLRYTICTYSAIVVKAVIDCWDKDPLIPNWVVLRSCLGHDVPLLTAFNPEWLARFRIDELYLNGDFDDILAEGHP